MTKEEAWLVWMKESNYYVEYEWDIIKKSSWWEAFSRGWDAASVNVNGWDDAYKMGVEAGKEKHWVGLTEEETKEISFNLPIKWTGHLQGASSIYDFARAIEAKLKEKNT